MSYIGKFPTAVPLTSGDITDGIITTAKIADDAISAAKLASGVGGKVLQVVSTTKTTNFSTSSQTFTDITGFSASITPSSSSNKILLVCSMITGGDDSSPRLRLLRDSTPIAISTETSAVSSLMSDARLSGVRHGVSNGFTFLDTPSTTSATTYKFQMRSAQGGACDFNHSGFDSTASTTDDGVSTINLLEIAG